MKEILFRHVVKCVPIKFCYDYKERDTTHQDLKIMTDKANCNLIPILLTSPLIMFQYYCAYDTVHPQKLYTHVQQMYANTCYMYVMYIVRIHVNCIVLRMYNHCYGVCEGMYVKVETSVMHNNWMVVDSTISALYILKNSSPNYC